MTADRLRQLENIQLTETFPDTEEISQQLEEIRRMIEIKQEKIYGLQEQKLVIKKSTMNVFRFITQARRN